MSMKFSLALWYSSLFLSCFATENPHYVLIEDQAKLPLLNPSLAERKVAKIRLDNGLQAYIVSDPGTKQSGAALSVEVGSWQDPQEYPGMAHFLEHMLFMGTSAYPKESEYMQYIHDHGGSVNASTWPDRTVYMFSINHDAFSGALDRFSHFFIDPLFLPSCIGRELLAVDQEHSKNIENDMWRQYMIFKETGNPLHPHTAFSTGNAKTLGGIPQSALKTWYQEHYSSDIMHLVVLSPLPIDELVHLVTQDFSSVPLHSKKSKELPLFLSSERQKGHMIYIKPIKELRTLSLTWELPKEFAIDFDKKPALVVSYALNSPAENSLISLLKKEKIAESLNASTDRFGKDTLLFTIDIQLTPYGLTQIDRTIQIAFQALAKFKAEPLPTHLFEEVKLLATLNYQYQSREDAFESVMHDAQALVDEPLSTYPEKTLIPSTFDPTFISSFLRALTPEECIFFVQADPQSVGVTLDAKEKWMDAEYTIKEIPREKLLSWKNPSLHPQLALPSPNPYIPTELHLVSTHSEPHLLLQDEGSTLYFGSAPSYFVPETTLFFHIKTPLLDGSAKSLALGELFLESLEEQLASPLYCASSAGLGAHFYLKDLKLSFAIQGYSDKAPLLAKTIGNALKKVRPTKEEFDIYKQVLLTAYDNSSKELPLFQAGELLSSILVNDMPTSNEKLRALKEVTYEEFLLFSSNLFKTAYLQGLAYGNLEEASLRSLWIELKDTLAFTPYLLADQHKKRVLVFPEKQTPMLISRHTERQGNGVILLLEEGPFTFERRAAQQVLSQALQDDFFETLRTKQQTAYIAKAADREIERQLMQTFSVQSSTHHPRDLLARFELFLEEFSRHTEEKISLERFKTIQQALITTLQMPPENVQLMGARLNLLAFEYDGDFAWIQKRIKALESLRYEDLLKASSELLSRSNGRRLAILMEGTPGKEPAMHYENVSKEDVCGWGTYISKGEL